MATGKVIIVDGGQTIYDIALQYYGSRDGDELLLQDNPELNGFDTLLFAGQKIKITQAPLNADVVLAYAKSNISPATEVDNIEDFELTGTAGDFDTESDFEGEDFY